MLTQHESKQAAMYQLDRRPFFRKLRVFLFFIPSALIALLFLLVNVAVLGESFLWNSASDMSQSIQGLSSNDILLGTLLALALTAINFCYLTLSTTMVVRAFKRNIWVNEESMDRFWIVFIITFVIFIFVSGLTFYSWLNIAFTGID